MTTTEAIAKLRELEMNQYAYVQAIGVLNYDGATCAPRGAAEARGRTMGILGGVQYQLLVNDQTAEVLNTILSDAANCDPQILREAEVLKKDYDKLTRVPMDEFVAYQTLVNDAQAVWHEAKEHSDYAMFKPCLTRLVEAQKRFAAYTDPSKPAYDAMLDSFEEGATMAVLDPFFDRLRKDLTPLIREVGKRPAPRTDFLHLDYPVEQQRVFSDRLMAMMDIDRAHCAIGETEHPFTDGYSKWDVRITTHYQVNDVSSSMFSVIHEGGHAIYELGTSDVLQFTCLAGGSTMGLHESQSRFYENIIGRSLPFCRAVLPLMKELFPAQLNGVNADDLYAAVNMAQPSLIRTEADELTYAMHVMIRYEIEKRLMAGDVTVDELPGLWNAMYKEYLGVTVPNDRAGVLQDSHWSGGAFGYFPSYALGSAYGAQMLAQMEHDVDFWPSVEQGDLSPVTHWLGEKIHRYGRLKTPAWLLENACGGAFDPSYFTDYLTKKYTALYHL